MNSSECPSTVIILVLEFELCGSECPSTVSILILEFGLCGRES